MTIVVALTSPIGPEGTQVLVASDRRRIDNGVPHDDRPKTFEYVSDDQMRAVLGGVAGQQDEGPGPPTHPTIIDIVKGLCAEATSLPDLIARCEERLTPIVPERNGLDVVLVATPTLSAMGVPEVHAIYYARRDVEGARTTPPTHGPASDGCASGTMTLRGTGDRPEVRQHLAKGWNVVSMRDVASGAIEAAIAACAHPDAVPPYKDSCGGDPSIVTRAFQYPPR